MQVENMELIEALRSLSKYSGFHPAFKAYDSIDFKDENVEYLRTIAVQLNNVAVDLYDNNESILAADFYISSLQLMMKLFQKKSVSSSIDEIIRVNEQKITTGKELHKKKSTAKRTIHIDQYYSTSKLSPSACLSDAIKIYDSNDTHLQFSILIFNLSLTQIKQGLNCFVKEQLQISLNLLSHACNGAALKVGILNSLGCLEFKENYFNIALNYFLSAKILGNKIITKCNDETSLRLNRLLGILSNNIGKIRVLQGKYEEALAQCSESIRISRKKPFGVDEEILVCVHNMGVIHSVAGELSKAVECYQYYLRHTNNLAQGGIDDSFPSQDAVTIILDILKVFAQQYIFGAKSSDILYCLTIIQQLRYQLSSDYEALPSMFRFIGEVFSELSYFRFSIIFLLEQLRLERKYLGHGHPSVASTLNVIGETYLQENDFHNALEYFEMTLIVLSHEKSEMNIRQYAVTVFNIGKVFFHTSSFSEAMKKIKIASCVLRDHFGGYDINLGDMLHQIGILHANLGHLDESFECLLEALMIRKLNYGKRHILVAKTLFHIGTNHELRGEYRESLNAYHETLYIMKSQSNDTDLTNEALIITVLNKISLACQAIDDLKDAIAAYEEILRLLNGTLGKNHALVASLLNLLGNVYIEYRLPEQGLKLYERSLDIMKNIDHFKDDLHDSRSDYEEAVFEALGYNFDPNPMHAAAA